MCAFVDADTHKVVSDITGSVLKIRNGRVLVRDPERPLSRSWVWVGDLPKRTNVMKTQTASLIHDERHEDTDDATDDKIRRIVMTAQMTRGSGDGSKSKSKLFSKSAFMTVVSVFVVVAACTLAAYTFEGDYKMYMMNVYGVPMSWLKDILYSVHQSARIVNGAGEDRFDASDTVFNQI